MRVYGYGGQKCLWYVDGGNWIRSTNTVASDFIFAQSIKVKYAYVRTIRGTYLKVYEITFATPLSELLLCP